VKSAVRLTLATPPPALKKGVTRVDVVGMSMRAVLVNNTILPPRFEYVGPGKIATLVDAVVVVPARITGVFVGNPESTLGTPVASITKLTTRLNRYPNDPVYAISVRDSMFAADTLPPTNAELRSWAAAGKETIEAKTKMTPSFIASSVAEPSGWRFHVAFPATVE
jgi:hypothetical protein